MELTLYSLGKGKPRKKRKQPFKSVEGNSGNKLLGISAKKLDLASSIGKYLTVQGLQINIQSGGTRRQAPSKSKSVCRISVFEKSPQPQLHLRMIAKGTHTITETVEADGHTWGKLESGQGWIAPLTIQRE